MKQVNNLKKGKIKMANLSLNKVWSESFISDGEVSVSVDPNTGDFDEDCITIIDLKCSEAHYDENGKLHIEFDEINRVTVSDDDEDLLDDDE